jgi:hypothetical protein
LYVAANSQTTTWKEKIKIPSNNTNTFTPPVTKPNELASTNGGDL